MNDRYGGTSAERILFDESDAAQPGIEPETKIWEGTKRIEARRSDEVIAELDVYLGVYQAEPEGDDEERYLYWLWTAARPIPESEAWIRRFWTGVDFTGGGELMTYTPESDRTNDGTVGPLAERTGQDSDEFAVRWEGDTVESQVIVGGCIERRMGADEMEFDWTSSLEADQ